MLKATLKSWFVLIFIAILLFSCKEESKKTIATESIDFTHEGDLTIFSSTSDIIKAKFNIEFAESDYETQTGLMYRKGMDNNQGMLFIFPNERMHSFYMKNTEFPLDIIYIKENLKIASFQENAQPLNEAGLSSQVPIKYVLEVNAGLVQELGLSTGDSINFNRK
ncbi:DUF192 domain-containing protein [Maribacter hydrothermalis]|uniref:DUF192 domain-containing protein n=1 Tax=Maribacter hydrothermalis TaxID=1836467 RepID=A0A1B7Z163_9FLAO|nr:DUF192 domain-containing protein [Maribacter hydrothermalis]APQ18109.1 hypothetical protein BTR34_12560 [Maribacter hydrothermalis]OBR36455.1 hypothetical protein A9200_08455 [Maribacter hydrothermalis]